MAAFSKMMFVSYFKCSTEAESIYKNKGRDHAVKKTQHNEENEPMTTSRRAKIPRDGLD
jgi:hypothetical protein